MAQFIIDIRTDLDKSLTQYTFGGKMFSQDNKANRINVYLYQNNIPVSATGDVVGIVKRNDGKAVAFPGGIDNGKPYIELPETAYAVEGPISILIRLTEGEIKTVIAICDAYVTKTADADYVTAGSTVVSIQELVNALDELDPLIARLNSINLDSLNEITNKLEDISEAEADLNELVTNTSAWYNNKVNTPTDNPNGVSGQVLRTNGDGTTTWVEVGLPTDSQTAQAVSNWLDEHPEATTTVQDGAITRAKLDADLQEKTDSVSDLKSALPDTASAIDMTICDMLNLVNYGYDTPQYRAPDPSATATNSLRLGFNRINTDIVFNNGNGNSRWVAVKLNGTIETTAAVNATIDGWVPSVEFKDGHKYKVTTKLVSGSASPLNETTHFYTGVMEGGSHTTIGSQSFSEDYTEHILSFNGNGNLFNVVFYAFSGMIFTDAKFHIVIEDVTYSSTEELSELVGQEAPSADDGYTWVIGGIKASGSNDSSNTRLRLMDYTLHLDYGTRIFCDESVEIVPFEYDENNSCIAKASDWETEYNVQTADGATVRIALRLASDPSHVMTSDDLATLPSRVHWGNSTGLVARVEKLEAQINAESIELPDYYKTEADDTIAKTKALQTEPCLVFPLVTDIHYKSAGTAQVFDACIKNMMYVLENIKSDCLLNLGDNTDGDHGDGSVTIERADYMLKKFLSLGIPVYQSVGNHDTNYESSGTRLTIGQTYRAYISGTKDVVFNSLTNGTDFYKDFNDVGIRLVVVNSDYLDQYTFSADTVTWLDEALNTSNIVIFATHVSPVNTQNYNAQSCDNKAGIINKLQGFINNGGTLIQLMGHSHVDVSFATPWLAIASCCQKSEMADTTAAGYQAITGYDSYGLVAQQRTPETASADCWNMVIVRPIARKIDLVRFGAGADREYSF